MRKLLGSLLLLVAVALIPAESVAQRRASARPARAPAQRTRFAAELDWSSDVDFGIGARAVFGLQSLFPKTPLDGIVSFDYFFPSKPVGVTSFKYWEINGNVAYRFRVPRSSLGPYAGGGLNIAHESVTPGSSATKAGLNLLGGTTFRIRGSNLTPFAEARGEIGGGRTFVLTGGVRF